MKNKTETSAFSGRELPVGPGATLRQVRERKGISRGYLQAQLGLTGSLLSALEEDDLARLPAPVYVRGYLRRYAELVGERAAPVLAGYQHLLEANGLAEPPRREEPPATPYKVMLGSAVAMLLATSLVFGAMLSESESEDSALQAAPESPLPAATDPVPAATGKGSLTLTFTADSWVEVVDARDHILAVSLQREGSVLSLDGQPPFAISLGHGPGVEVSYQGAPVAFEYEPETFASKFVVGK